MIMIAQHRRQSASLDLDLADWVKGDHEDDLFNPGGKNDAHTGSPLL